MEKTPSVAISLKRAPSLRLLQPRLQLTHVGIGEAVALGLAEPDAVDDRGVVQRIGDDRVLRPEQRLEHAAIRVEAGGEEDRIVLAEPARDPLLEPPMQRLRSADEAHGSHAEAELVERLARRRDDLRMIGKAEIVVGAEVQELALAALRPRIADADMRRLRRGDHPLALQKAVGLDRGELGIEMGEEGMRHGGPREGAPRS